MNRANLPALILQSHGIVLFIFWGVGLDLSRVVIRYLAHLPSALYLHSSLNLMSASVTLVYVCYLLVQKWGDLFSSGNEVLLAHALVAVLLVLLFAAQSGLGISLKWGVLSIEPVDLGLKRMLHKIVGLIIWLLAKSELIIGVVLNSRITGSPNLVIALGIYLGVLVIVLAVLELFYRLQPTIFLREKNNAKGVSEEFAAHAESILQFYDKGAALRDIRFQFLQFKFIVFMNSLYEIKELVHPGGAWLLEQLRGQEIAPFFLGGHALPGSGFRHQHTIYASHFLTNKCAGTIRQPAILQTRQGVKQQDLSFWELRQRIRINENVAVIKLRSNTKAIVPYLKGIEWLGRYMLLASRDDQTLNNTWRPYSIALCLTDFRIQLRQQLLAAFLELLKGRKAALPQWSLQPVDTLSFIVKLYPTGKLSPFLHSKSSVFLKLNGPMGLGLRVPESFGGVLVLVAGGTGIVPFLDLLDFLLMKAVWTVARSKGAQFNVFNEDYENIFPNMRTHLFCSFPSRDQFYGYSIVMMLLQICTEFKLGLFKLTLRYSQAEQEEEGVDLVDQKFNSQIFGERLPVTPSIALVSGPDEMCVESVEGLAAIGVDQTNITVL